MLIEAKNSFLRRSTEARESELETLMRNLEKEVADLYSFNTFNRSLLNVSIYGELFDELFLMDFNFTAHS